MVILFTFQRDTSYESQTFFENEHCGTIEDCFDLPCPRYGWHVKITYLKDCEHNICPENHAFTGRLTDPICRTEYNL